MWKTAARKNRSGATHALTTGGTVSALSKRYVNILTACANMQMLQRKQAGKQRLKGRVCVAFGIFVHMCA